jgi:hypothetical protein
MGQVLHGSARTTEAIRRAIQHSQESLRSLAKRHGINQKTVAQAGQKWIESCETAKLERATLSGFGRPVFNPNGDHR